MSENVLVGYQLLILLLSNRKNELNIRKNVKTVNSKYLTTEKVLQSLCFEKKRKSNRIKPKLAFSF